MTSIQVRRATAADAEAIGWLPGALGYPTVSGDVPGPLAMVEAEGGAAFVATHEREQVVGVATVIPYMALHRPGPGA